MLAAGGAVVVGPESTLSATARAVQQVIGYARWGREKSRLQPDDNRGAADQYSSCTQTEEA